MQQFYWGYNYLYLRHETTIIRVNLKNHSIKDVTHMLVEEFDLASSETSSSFSKEPANLWICGASKASMLTNGIEWRKEVTDDAFVPIPYLEEKFEPNEWAHCLATIDVSALNHGTKSCDEDEYNIVPIQMIGILLCIQKEEPLRTGGLPLPVGNKTILPPSYLYWKESKVAPEAN